MQDKNVDFCGILNLLAALKRAGFPKAELEQVAVRNRNADRRNDPDFFLNFFAKISSFTVAVVVCCVATRRR